jgi:Protein of unknown function (DUF2971)
MALIFKYCKAEYGIAALKQLEVRTSIPSALNDPFELSPNIDPRQFTQRRIEAVLRQDHHIDEAYRKEAGSRGFANKRQFKKWYLKDVPRRAAEKLPRIPPNVDKVRQNFAEQFTRYWRLVCASAIYDSILMWSHYADNHTGLVLAFDTTEPPFSQIPPDCWLRVRYSDTKPDYIFSHKQQEFQQKMFAVAGTKASAWAYEREVRIIVADTALRANRFLPLSPKSISAVYCGCRISSSDSAAVEQLLHTDQLGHVDLLMAALSTSEYALEFHKIDR